MEKVLVKKVDEVITVNIPLNEYFSKLTDAPITIVMNCKDLVIENYTPPEHDVFTISYIGVLNKARLFPDLVDIIGNIDNVKFVIAGKKENLYESVKEHSKRFKNIDFLGSIPTDEVLQRTLESNVIICMFDPSDKNNQVGLPNKIFEAMVTGRPIIVTKDLYSGKFVDDLNCGISIEYNKKSVSDAIVYLRDNPQLCEQFGRNGLIAAQEKYNWDRQSKNLIDLYRKLSP